MSAVQIYYALVSLISFALLLVYIYRWQKHFDVHMTVAFVFIPIVNIAFFLMYSTPDTEAAVVALKVVYSAACFLPWMIMMCVASLCRIRINRIIRLLTFVLNAVIYGFVITIGYNSLFYKSVTVEEIGSAFVMKKEYGPIHTVNYIVIVLHLIVDVAMILYAYRKKKQVSRLVLLLLFVPIPVTIAGYYVNHYTSGQGVEIIPALYVFAQIIYLFIVHRMVLYDVSDMVVETMVESGKTGFITVDFKKRYLGSNETAGTVLPDLKTLAVDGPVGATEELKATVETWIDRFREDPDPDNVIYYNCPGDSGPDSERIIAVKVNYLYDGRRRRGYQLFLEDDTQNQRYISLIGKYNSDLQKDVAAKTARIEEMHDRLVLGMAAMVEGRDNSTGGHIRRTSEGVRILIGLMRRDGKLELTDEFCKDIIKAAPMHDLGKIAVDDAVLRKNGPFTPEEREKMKKHAAEGARIVHEILKDSDDEYFHIIAENVAHYHHERFDGTGYPDGLRGDAIPLEARIMAIADVYDALVSKRVYKEKMSFEEADRIIIEGMGTQFDPGLRSYYEQARPELESFYSSEQ